MHLPGTHATILWRLYAKRRFVGSRGLHRSAGAQFGTGAAGFENWKGVYDSTHDQVLTVLLQFFKQIQVFLTTMIRSFAP